MSWRQKYMKSLRFSRERILCSVLSSWAHSAAGILALQLGTQSRYVHVRRLSLDLGSSTEAVRLCRFVMQIRDQFDSIGKLKSPWWTLQPSCHFQSVKKTKSLLPISVAKDVLSIMTLEAYHSRGFSSQPQMETGEEATFISRLHCQFLDARKRREWKGRHRTLVISLISSPL